MADLVENSREKEREEFEKNILDKKLLKKIIYAYIGVSY